MTCLLMRTGRLYSFVDRDPRLLMAPVSRTHGASTLAQLGCFVALNSALAVDLTGQVNADGIGSDYVGLVGGQVNYLRGAMASEGGCAMIALPAMAEGRSRIVAQLSGPVTTPRSDVGVVVTQYGAADLRALSLRGRVRRMIAIADPAVRAYLERQAHALWLS